MPAMSYPNQIWLDLSIKMVSQEEEEEEGRPPSVDTNGLSQVGIHWYIMSSAVAGTLVGRLF